MHSPRRLIQGFTLFEVMISMLVLTFAILATVTILPIGLRAQQLARSQMFAAATATTIINEFHNPLVTFKGISSLEPNYSGPTTQNADPAHPPSASLPPLTGWATQLRNASVFSSPYQSNAEDVLDGWFSGVLPVPLPIARRLESDNDEIGKLLDQGAFLFYPDPNFMQGFNQGGAQDTALSVAPAPEMQKLVFAFVGFPQQNALATHPVESLPWYENYPFCPAWLSMQAVGGESRKLGMIPFDWSTGPTSEGHRSGISGSGRDTGDWSINSGVMHYSDAGHALYYPVLFSAPFHQGQDSGTWFAQRPVDDPDADDHYLDADAGGLAFFEGNGFYQGRNWRYFANGNKNANNLWYCGNGLAAAAGGDPMYSAVDPFTGLNYSNEWAYICFQRLSGGDDRFLGFPRNDYTNTLPASPFVAMASNYPEMDANQAGNPLVQDQQNDAWLPADTVVSVTQDTTIGTPAPVAVTPAQSFPTHPPATFHRSGWLPIRALLTNPSDTCYQGMMQTPSNPWIQPHPGDPYNFGIPDPFAFNTPSFPWRPVQGPTDPWTTSDGINNLLWKSPENGGGAPQLAAKDRAWNILTMSGLPQTSQPLATYEMRANYRDRAIDLWQAVMPAHDPQFAIMTKDPVAVVNDGAPNDGGTEVDCPKYEYPPNELERFRLISPQKLTSDDMPIHPAQVLALSYLAHAAMMVTGYGPPFGMQMPQDAKNFADTIRMSWDGLNWTYAQTAWEASRGIAGNGLPSFPQAPMNPNSSALQGMYKDVLYIAKTQTYAQTNVGPQNGNAVITLTNENMYPWIIYPGDEIVLQTSYLQWYSRYGVPWRNGGSIWDGPQDDPHKEITERSGDPTIQGFYDDSVTPSAPYPPIASPAGNLQYPAINYKLQTYRVLSVQGPNDPIARIIVPPNNLDQLPDDTLAHQQMPGIVNPGVPAGIIGGVFVPGAVVTITLSAPLAQEPLDPTDGSTNYMTIPPPRGGLAINSVTAGEMVRRICNPADQAFARKSYEMCMEWAAAYAAENPDDAGAPRMANHQLMTDKPLAIFDLFYDAATGSTPGLAVRSPKNAQTANASATALATYTLESFYRWMVPSNPAPQTWFWGASESSTGQHDNSHIGPGWARNKNFDQAVHNYQLIPPTPQYDDQHFWLTKPFAPFHRARALKFWSVDWKSYADAETAPSAPVDFAKHNRFPLYDGSTSAYDAIVPNMTFGLASASSGDGHSVLCGPPESLYVWTDPSRTQRYGDVVGGDYAGYLYQNLFLDAGNNAPWSEAGTFKTEPPATNGQPVTIDVHLGHWGADRNGNGKLDIGPVSTSTRMRALTVGEYLYYDPVLRLNAGN